MKRVRDVTLLTLGAVGFLSQVAAQFSGGQPNYIIMAGALSVLLGVPLLRADDRKDGP